MRWLLVLSLLFFHSAGAQTISGVVVSIADGDTLTILDSEKRQHKIRLADIDAPEKRQPFGTRSRQSLAELCFQKPATVKQRDLDRYGRIVGYVNCAGVSANAEQVRRGMAWVYVRYAPKDSPLYQTEEQARSQRAGLWIDANSTPPWLFRSHR